MSIPSDATEVGAAEDANSEVDDAAAIEIGARPEAREVRPQDGGTELKPIRDLGEEALEQAYTEVLDTAEAELLSISSRLMSPSEIQPVSTGAPDLPDNFRAGSVYTDRRGVIYATSGVSLTLRSVLPQGEALVEADNASYDPESGVIELDGNVRLGVAGVNFRALAPAVGGAGADAGGAGFDPRYFSESTSKSATGFSDTGPGEGSLFLEADWLEADTVMNQLRVRGLKLDLSLEELLGPDAIDELPLRTDFRNRLVPHTPREIFLSSDSLYFSQGIRETDLVLEGVKISLSPHPDPDLYLTARRVELVNQQQVIFTGLRLHVSGFDWISWPRLSRSLKRSSSTLSLDTPQFQVDREFGIAVKQGTTIDLDVFKTDALVDYSPEYGFLAKSYFYLEPVEGTQVGVQVGRSTQSNIERNTVLRRDDYNLIYRQALRPGGAVERMQFEAQYGEIHERVPGRPNLGMPDLVAEDTRALADFDMQLTPMEIGKQLYFTSGAQARYIHYEETGEDYRVLGGRAGIVWRHDGFDHFVLYRYNNVSGEPIFTFDQIRRERLDFATSVQTTPNWRNVLRGSFDPLREEFERLQLGTFKQQRSYELGVFWDFARESAEFEFGLLLD